MSSPSADDHTFDILLAAAIKFANYDTREPVWYGPWNLVQQFMFRHISDSEIVTVTYPQFTVDRYYNPHALVDEDDDSYAEFLDDDIPEAGSDPVQSSLDVFGGPVETVAADHMNIDDPGQGYTLGPLRSPSYLRHLPSSPDSPLQLVRSNAPTPSTTAMVRRVETEHSPSPGAVRAKYLAEALAAHLLERFCRIPDSTEIAHQRWKGGKSRFLLFVEVKPKREMMETDTIYHRKLQFLFNRVTKQTRDQASFAFSNPENTESKALGVIIAIGACWTYVEYHKSDFPPSPQGSAKDDSDYDDKSSPQLSRRKGKSVVPFVAKPAPSLAEKFHGREWLDLQDKQGWSKIALIAVANRVKELQIDFWKEAEARRKALAL